MDADGLLEQLVLRLASGRLGGSTGFLGVRGTRSEHIINLVGRATVFARKVALG